MYDFLSPMNGFLVHITALQGSGDLKGGEVIAFMASSADHITSVKFEAAKEVAEGRVLEHGVDKTPSSSTGASSSTTTTASSSSSTLGSMPESSNELKDWLLRVGGAEMLEYEAAMRKDGFDSLNSMAMLEEKDLDDMGITKKGHRKLLVHAAGELKKKPATSA